jgi:hypothetical protein
LSKKNNKHTNKFKNPNPTSDKKWFCASLYHHKKKMSLKKSVHGEKEPNKANPEEEANLNNASPTNTTTTLVNNKLKGPLKVETALAPDVLASDDTQRGGQQQMLEVVLRRAKQLAKQAWDGKLGNNKTGGS